MVDKLRKSTLASGVPLLNPYPFPGKNPLISREKRVPFPSR